MGDGAAGRAEQGDLRRSPLAYPLEPVAGPRLVLAGCDHPIRPRLWRRLASAATASCPRCAPLLGAAGRLPLARALAALGVTPLGERTPVLAVGSNAAAPVLRDKLARGGASGVVPVLTGVVAGLGVAHSAHVARGGYVPAAPVHRTGARTPVVLQLLDDDQLAALDVTEPNYERVALAADRYPLVLAGGVRPARVHVYASRHGVLRLPGGRRAHLLSQPEVLGALDTAGVPHTGGDPRRAVRALAGSPALREAVRAAMGRLGLARPASLHHLPAGRLRWSEPAAARPQEGRRSPVRAARAASTRASKSAAPSASSACH